MAAPFAGPPIAETFILALRPIPLVPSLAVILTLFLGFSVPSVPAEDCTDYEDYIHWVGRLHEAPVRDIAFRIDVAFVVAGDGLHLMDFSDPISPATLLTLPAASGHEICLAGDYALVIQNGSGRALLWAIDFSDLMHPVHRETVVIPHTVTGMELNEDHLYITVGDAGIEVVDVSEPWSPEPIRTIDTPGSAQGIDIEGAFAYVADSANGLQVYDLSDPADPSFVGQVTTPDDANAVDVAGTIAAVAIDQAGVAVIDVSDPGAPVILGSADTPGQALGVAATDSLVFLSCNESGFHAVDIADPESPEVVWTSIVIDRPGDVLLRDAYVYLLGDSPQIYVRGDYPPPGVIGQVETAGEACGIAVAGSVACMASCDHYTGPGLQLIDISDPTSPSVVGAWGYEASDVDMAGDYAFAVWGSGGGGWLWITDISDPGNPTGVGDIRLQDGSPDRVVVADGYAYVKAWESYAMRFILIVDVNEPTSPEIVGRTHSLVFLEDVAVAGSYAYVTYEYGLEVIDVSDPASPVAVGAVGMDWGHRLSVCGDMAYVTSQSGVHAVDVSDPAAPAVIGELHVPGFLYGIAVRGSYAYVDLCRNPYLPSEIHVIDVSDPTSLTPAGELPMPGCARDMVVAGDCLLMAAGELGLQIARAQCEAPTHIAAEPLVGNTPPREGFLRVEPNPTTSRATLAFELPRPADIRLEIFDVAGRRVRRIVAGRAGPGILSVNWDGRDSKGSPVASGIYFARLAWDGGSLIEPLVVVR